MYCSSCGVAVIQDLNYCKRCGAKLGEARERDADKLSEGSVVFLLAGVLGIPIAGLGIIIGLMEVMKKEIGFSNELIIVFTCASFLLLLAAESVFIWLLWNRARAVKAANENARLKEIAASKLGEAQGLPEPAPSIARSTTPSLEPLHHERTTK